MKTILRAVSVNLLTLYLADLLLIGFTVPREGTILILSAFVWTILNKFIKPLLKLLLLPINLITLGLFSWVISVATLFLLTYFIRGISVQSFFFPGFTWNGFVIPTASVNLFFSYLFTSIFLNLIHSAIIWLIRS
ncbi:phage holin family protein [Candidatus Collierbacteria bacterium]|nr:phage holin family protein [Candidatus Collierbacteria bacterium]